MTEWSLLLSSEAFISGTRSGEADTGARGKEAAWRNEGRAESGSIHSSGGDDERDEDKVEPGRLGDLSPGATRRWESRKWESRLSAVEKLESDMWSSKRERKGLREDSVRSVSRRVCKDERREKDSVEREVMVDILAEKGEPVLNIWRAWGKKGGYDGIVWTVLRDTARRQVVGRWEETRWI